MKDEIQQILNALKDKKALGFCPRVALLFSL